VSGATGGSSARVLHLQTARAVKPPVAPSPVRPARRPWHPSPPRSAPRLRRDVPPLPADPSAAI